MCERGLKRGEKGRGKRRGREEEEGREMGALDEEKTIILIAAIKTSKTNSDLKSNKPEIKKESAVTVTFFFNY